MKRMTHSAQNFMEQVERTLKHAIKFFTYVSYAEIEKLYPTFHLCPVERGELRLCLLCQVHRCVNLLFVCRVESQLKKITSHSVEMKAKITAQRSSRNRGDIFVIEQGIILNLTCTTTPRMDIFKVTTISFTVAPA